MPDINVSGGNEYVDLEVGLTRVRGNKTIYKKMLGLFLKSGEFAAFEDAMAQQDYKRAGEVAHGIKGMTGNLALTRVFDLSAELMNALRNGSAPDEKLLADYREAVEKTREVVQQLEAEME